MTNEELIDIAVRALNRRVVKRRLFGDVAAALVTSSGRVFTGVCVDTPSWGLCAERSAIASMVSSGEYQIATIVAVWKPDAPSGDVHVLPPCGICRQFMRDVDEGNLETGIVLGKAHIVTLKELLPYHEWPEPLNYE